MLRVETSHLLLEGGRGYTDHAEVQWAASGDVEMVLVVVKVMHPGLCRRMTIQGAHRAIVVVPMMILVMKMTLILRMTMRKKQVEHPVPVTRKACRQVVPSTLRWLAPPSNLRKAASFSFKRGFAGNSWITLRGRVVETSLKRLMDAGTRVVAG
jgi:hypothetical protein